jgi:probable addiction module antidote protein
MPDSDLPALSTLNSLEAVAGYLAAAFDAGDPDTMVQALALVARSEGLAHLAAAAGLPRARLAEALGAGEIGLDTLLSIMKVIDLHRPADGAPN